MTDWTPAALSRSTASVASESVLAVSVGSPAIVTTTGTMPIAFRSGKRYEVERALVVVWSETTTPTFGPWPRRPELRPQLTVAARYGGVIRPRPPQVRGAEIRPVGRRRPLGDHRRVTFLGDTELIDPFECAEPIEDGEHRWVAHGPLFAQ